MMTTHSDMVKITPGKPIIEESSFDLDNKLKDINPKTI